MINYIDDLAQTCKGDPSLSLSGRGYGGREHVRSVGHRSLKGHVTIRGK